MVSNIKNVDVNKCFVTIVLPFIICDRSGVVVDSRQIVTWYKSALVHPLASRGSKADHAFTVLP